MVERKYYTLAEAAQAAGLPESDIYHYLETKQLPGSLLSPRRKYLIVTSEEEGSYVARGQISFAGLLTPHTSWIKLLLDKKKITLDRIAKPVYSSEYRDYSANNPYHSGMLPKTISEWISTSWDGLRSKQIWLLPMPELRQSYLYQFSEIIQKWGEAQGTKVSSSLSENKPPEFVFDTYKNGVFELRDLRIAATNLDKLIHSQIRQSDESENSNPDHDPSAVELKWCNSKKRPLRIYPVIESVFILNKGVTGPDLWKILMDDINNDDSIYDLEGIVHGIDAKSLEWETARGDSRPLTKKSFLNKISALRNFYGQ